MEVIALASSSSGNCYLIDDGRTMIMIECGISWKTIQKKMNFKTYLVQGTLVSHCHKDHSGCISDVIRAGINVYSSQDTFSALGISGHRVIPILAMEQFEIGTYVILPFEVQHDVTNYGYLIYSKVLDEKLLFITDTYYCRYKFENLNYIMVECNYDKEILDNNVSKGLIHKALKNRLLKSHFSLTNVKKFLLANDLSKVRCVYLMHLSDGNSNAVKFKSEIEKLIGIPVEICDKEFSGSNA